MGVTIIPDNQIPEASRVIIITQTKGTEPRAIRSEPITVSIATAITRNGTWSSRDVNSVERLAEARKLSTALALRYRHANVRPFKRLPAGNGLIEKRVIPSSCIGSIVSPRRKKKERRKGRRREEKLFFRFSVQRTFPTVLIWRTLGVRGWLGAINKPRAHWSKWLCF